MSALRGVPLNGWPSRNVRLTRACSGHGTAGDGLATCYTSRCGAAAVMRGSLDAVTTVRNLLNAARVLVLGDVAASAAAFLYLSFHLAMRRSTESNDLASIGVGANIAMILATATAVGLLAIALLMVAACIDATARRRSTIYWAVLAASGPPLVALALFALSGHGLAD